MCLYTKYIENPKYKPNKKNGGKPPPCPDERLRYVPAKCNKCIECRKQKQREWIVRLSEEIRCNKYIFVTLTLSNESFLKLREICNGDENTIMTKAHRLFLERIRKDTGRSVRHWAITELGEDTARIHLHGLYSCSKEIIEKNWKYGHVFIGSFVNERTIFYITKYMLKTSPKQKNFQGVILSSSGLGANYTKRKDAKRNSYKENETDETYRLRDGRKINLPQYYRNKLYTEEQKDRLWIEKQEKGYRYIMGEKVQLENEDEYINLLEFYRRKSVELYKDNPEEWEKERHLRRLRKIREYLERCRNGASNDPKKKGKRTV